MRGSVLGLSLLVLVSGFAASKGDAQVTEDQLLFDDIEPTMNARFGSAIATAGNWAVIGAPGDEGFTGSAYLWGFASAGKDEGTWLRLGKVKADLPDEDAQFGKSVAISGDVAVVGSPFWATDGYGAAYVFRLNEDSGLWEFEQRLTPTLAFSQSNAGWSVGISGDLLVIAAYYSPPPAEKVFVYGYDGETWVKQQDLPFTGTGAVSVAISAGMIAVKSASLKIFRRTGGTWSEESDFGPVGDFALYRNRLLVGDTGDDLLGENAGAAILYRFVESGWKTEQTLRASDGEAGDAFGSQVSLTYQRALVVAGQDLAGASSAYVFEFDGSTWMETAKLAASDGAPGQQFGSSAAVTHQAALIGAPFYTRSLNQDGVAYSFELPEPSATALGLAALAALALLGRAGRAR